MRQRPLVVALIVALGVPVLAQIRVPGTPAARASALEGPVPTVFVASPDVANFEAEDAWNEANGVPGPLRYGAVVPVDVGLEAGGRWDVTADGELVWRVRLESPGAHSLGVELGTFRMPPGAQLFVYDDELSNVFGAYDATQHNPDGSLAIEPFPGDSLVLEYKQPAGLPDIGGIRVRAVIHDYRDVFRLQRELEATGGSGGGVTGGCTVGANCPPAAPYQELRRSTMRTFYGGGLCSASLINNTLSDGTGYVYTASHCGQAGSTVFRFLYEQPNCESGSAPTNMSISGASLLASHTKSDGRLLRINASIPASYDPYFNGWSRSTSNPSLCVSFHHPGGGPKAFSLDSNGASKATINVGGIGLVDTWNVFMSTGGLAGGSSGGPLADANLRTIGTATALSVGSCFDAYYGRFYSFWNAVNIAQYLDPTGSGTVTVDGFDPSAPNCTTPFNYGAADVSTQGNTAQISTSGGDPSVSNPNFTIELTGGNPNQGAILLESGAGQGSTPAPWGTILVGAPFLRHKNFTSAAGTASYPVPMTSSMVGQTLNWMWIIRDPGPTGAIAHHSAGLEITFCQ